MELMETVTIVPTNQNCPPVSHLSWVLE